MELFYLLCSIVSTLISSTVLSLILAIKHLSHFVYFPAKNNIAVQLYKGIVIHSRTKPVSNSFDYSVRYALFDLDRVPLHSNLSADLARKSAGTHGPVFLLTIPTSVGYAQNPLKVYYCYDLVEEVEKESVPSLCLKKCIAEVTNTPWGEIVFFEFLPGSDIVAKPLHVSPFMDMLGNWTIHANEPGENLFISISVQHPTLGNYFFASLSATRVHTSTTLLNLEMYFWLVPHKVAALIYWQAFKLWWKNVQFIGHPKYSNSSYRDDALSRDKELCPLSNLLNQNSNGKSRTRWCIWKDAEWPWA